MVVVAFMNTEGPLVQFPMSYYPCYKEFIATYEIRSLLTIIRKGGEVKRFEVVERGGGGGGVKCLTQLKRGEGSVMFAHAKFTFCRPPWRKIITGPLDSKCFKCTAIVCLFSNYRRSVRVR